MPKQNIECKCNVEDCWSSVWHGDLICKCKCHSPKVENTKASDIWNTPSPAYLEATSTPKVKLPEWWEEEYDKKWEYGIGIKLRDREPIKQFIRQTLSHSTTQLVEKIKGECEGLKMKHQPQDPTWAEGHDQALSEVIKIISKYK